MLSLKLIRNIVIAFFVLGIGIFIAGFLYVYFTDNSITYTKTSSVINSNGSRSSFPQPQLPGPNAKEGAYIESLDSPVTVGSNTSAIVNTNANSICSISVTYNGVSSKVPGLAPQKANSYGTVTWTWNVPSNTPIGNWPVKIICTYNKQNIIAEGNLEVVPVGNP